MGIVIPFPTRIESLMAKPFSWFRMYAEFATDPVVQSLAFEDQRHFLIVLCLKCSGLLDRAFSDPQARTVMLRRGLGLDAGAFDEAKRRMQGSGLIDVDWQPVNWNKRQFLSDHDPTAAERKRKQRLKGRDGDVTRDSRTGHTAQSQSQSQNKTPASLADVDSDLDPEAYLIWNAGVDLVGESKRGLLGKLVKQHGQSVVASKIAELMAMSDKPRDPASYLVGALRKQERRFVC